MMRFILPAFLIGLSVAIFLVFTNPTYKQIMDLRAQVASYDEALNNSRMLKEERDKLTTKSNSITQEDKDKLDKLLPENIDNIRLILEIEQIASPYGMALKDVKYNATQAKDTSTDPAAAGAIQGGAVKYAQKDYGVWDLSFSTTGTYNNFLNFLTSLESNLRIVDVASINFTATPAVALPGSNIGSTGITGAASTSATGGTSLNDSYRYDFKIKTYWLKN